MNPTDQQSFTLENGLGITLIHDPHATRAAALIQLAAGSHQEPVAWPGLAHLLEHVLFAGSEGFQDEQRLLAWAPAQGARLNATTLANQTAWFFEITPPLLADGLNRLVDMLARPLLSVAAVEREVRIIDAEYQMLTSHNATRCEAALSQAFFAPHPFHHFHVGNLAHFGEDLPALRQALQHYHQHYFRAPHLRLWLQGPQSIAELAVLAQTLGQAFSPLSTASPPCAVVADEAISAIASVRPVAPIVDDVQPPTPLILRAERAFALQSPAAEQLLLSFPLTRITPAVLSVLRELLTDQAANSLLSTLQARGLCHDIQLWEPYRSPQQSLLSVVFQLSAPRREQGAAIEAVFRRWLQCLAGLTPRQLVHYASLSQRHFARLTPLDQLRALAFGFPPASTAIFPHSAAHSAWLNNWHKLLAQLTPENTTRLWLTPDTPLPVTHAQGFALNSAPIDWPVLPVVQDDPSLRQSTRGDGDTLANMAFHQPGATLPQPILPVATAALQAFPASGEATLLLSPLADQQLPPRRAALIAAALQPVIAECQHHGGELHFSQQQGIWLLQLSGSRELLLFSLDKVLTVLTAPSTAAIAQSERLYRQARQALVSDIAVRCLLNQLPTLLQSPADDGHEVIWQAALYGGDRELYQALAHLLSRFPAPLQANRLTSTPTLPSEAEYTFTTQSRDAAVIVFCPLAIFGQLSLATGQLLAALFAPRFFQRLRVEKNIGYVVSCRFHQTAGQAGLLFALQSPTFPTTGLYHGIRAFLHEMAEDIIALSAEELQEKIRALQHSLPVPPVCSPAQCVEHWLDHQLNIPPLTEEIYARISMENLRQAQQYLSENPHRCWFLSNNPCASPC